MRRALLTFALLMGMFLDILRTNPKAIEVEAD